MTDGYHPLLVFLQKTVRGFSQWSDGCVSYPFKHEELGRLSTATGRLAV